MNKNRLQCKSLNHHILLAWYVGSIINIINIVLLSEVWRTEYRVISLSSQKKKKKRYSYFIFFSFAQTT